MGVFSARSREREFVLFFFCQVVAAANRCDDVGDCVCATAVSVPRLEGPKIRAEGAVAEYLLDPGTRRYDPVDDVAAAEAADG